MDKWGTIQWFDHMFECNEKEGDSWGHRWRGSQKFRYNLYVKMLRLILPSKKKIKILDIGCALGDFTKRAWQLDPKNEIFGVDTSGNAIDRVSKIYPNMKFRVASLPALPFNENSFDLILCLEVLYYLNSDDRIKSLENIRKSLKTDGYLFFSGVLDGGVRYFAEDEIVELISKYFYIERIEYNYARIYTKIESEILSLLNICEIAEMVFNMQDAEFLEWCGERTDKRKVEKVTRFWKIVNKIPFGPNIVKAIDRFMSLIIRGMLSWEIPVSISYKLTKLILREKGKTQIIILARSDKEGVS